MATSARPTASKQRKKSGFSTQDPRIPRKGYTAIDDSGHSSITHIAPLDSNVTFFQLLEEARAHGGSSGERWHFLESRLVAEVLSHHSMDGVMHPLDLKDPILAMEATVRCALRTVLPLPYHHDSRSQIDSQRIEPEWKTYSDEGIGRIPPRQVRIGFISLELQGIDPRFEYHLLRIPIGITKAQAEAELVGWVKKNVPKALGSRKKDIECTIYRVLVFVASRDRLIAGSSKKEAEILSAMRSLPMISRFCPKGDAFRRTDITSSVNYVWRIVSRVATEARRRILET